jgi:hypothetical protein
LSHHLSHRSARFLRRPSASPWLTRGQ